MSVKDQSFGTPRASRLYDALLDAMLTVLTTKDQTERTTAVRKISDINSALMTKFEALDGSFDLPLTSERIVVLLRKSGISQAELADRICVTRSNVTEWIKGTRPIPQKHAKKVYMACVGSAFTTLSEVASILDDLDKQSAA
jgi:DNA-binding transcriptional regulator YiaG